MMGAFKGKINFALPYVILHLSWASIDSGYFTKMIAYDTHTNM